MNLLKTVLTSAIPGGQMLSMFLTSIGGSQREDVAVNGLYQHLRSSAIGTLLPPDIGVLVKLFASGASLPLPLAGALSGVLSNNDVANLVAAQIDGLIGSYEGADDVVAVIEKMSSKGIIPVPDAASTLGTFVVERLRAVVPQPKADSQPIIDIPHTCPKCSFHHVVRAGVKI